MSAPTPRRPGDGHPHVAEGICTCGHGDNADPSVHCGLSSHRVAAAAARVAAREARGG